MQRERTHMHVRKGCSGNGHGSPGCNAAMSGDIGPHIGFGGASGRIAKLGEGGSGP